MQKALHLKKGFLKNTLINAEKLNKTIDAISFDKIISKLSENLTWSEKAEKEACKQYKRFLFLQKKYGDKYTLVPSIEIDEFWHQHILFTTQYQTDCEQIFGKYLHHIPTLKKTSSNTINAEIQKNFKTTQKLYRREFGEYIYEIRWVMLLHHVASSFLASIQLLKTKFRYRK